MGVRDVRGRGWELALSEALCAVCNWLCGCAWASGWARLGVPGVARGERGERHREASKWSAAPRQNARREPDSRVPLPLPLPWTVDQKVKPIILKVPPFRAVQYGCVGVCAHVMPRVVERRVHGRD